MKKLKREVDEQLAKNIVYRRLLFLKKRCPLPEYLIPLIYREETRNEGRDICKINCTWNIYVVAADVHSMYTAASNI